MSLQSKSSCAVSPCSGQPVMFRTVSPQPPAVVMPARSRSAKTFGSSLRASQCSWMFWRVASSRVAAAVAVRDLADRAQLRGGQLAARQLDAEHERADLRLVVVEAPPLQADDVLLGHALVALRDQGRKLVADPERILLLLQALDGIALEDEVPRRGRLLGAHRRILQ